MIDTILGFDVGTTSVKAGLFTVEDGRLLGIARAAYPTSRPRDGWVEQDPRDWTRAMAECWVDLARRVGAVRLRSIGICSQVNTHVLVDDSLSPLRPAIVWQDVRTEAVAAELDAQVAAAERTRLWGGPFTIDASFSLSRLEWLRRHERDTVEAARWLLQPKEYCVAAICGAVVTDTLSPIGLVGQDGAYVRGVTDLVEGSARLLPELRWFDELAGTTRAGNPVGLPEGVPVAVGTMDAWANVYGSGVTQPSQAIEVAGTSEIVGVLSDQAVPTPGVITFPTVRDRYLHAGPTQAGGDALAWAARCFGTSIEGILAEAARGLSDPQPIVFLPHLAGERAPLWNPEARGLFLGLSTSTELRHLALAVLEGVAFSARQLLEACEEAAGGPATDIRLSGGGARSADWNRIKASAHGRPLNLLAVLESGVLGAALMGAVAADLEANLEEAALRRVALAGQIEPELAESARLEHLYGVYRETYATLAGLFPKLAPTSSRGPAVG
ncbi:MAG: xylulose kinase [Chloroflexota bacterium]